MSGFIWPPPRDDQATLLQLRLAELNNIVPREYYAAAHVVYDPLAAPAPQLDDAQQPQQVIVNGDPIAEDNQAQALEEIRVPIGGQYEPFSLAGHSQLLFAQLDNQSIQLQQRMGAVQQNQADSPDAPRQQPLEAAYPWNVPAAVAEQHDDQVQPPQDDLNVQYPAAAAAIVAHLNAAPIPLDFASFLRVQREQAALNLPQNSSLFNADSPQLVVPMEAPQEPAILAGAEQYDAQLLQQPQVGLNIPPVPHLFQGAVMAEPKDSQQLQQFDVNQNSPGVLAQLAMDVMNLPGGGSPNAVQLQQQQADVNILQNSPGYQPDLQQIVVPMEAPYEEAEQPALSPAAYEAQKILIANVENFNKPMITPVSPEVQKELEPYGASFPKLSSTLIRDLGRPVAMRLAADLMEELQLPQELIQQLHLLQQADLQGANPAGEAAPEPVEGELNPFENLAARYGIADAPAAQLAGPAVQQEEEDQQRINDTPFFPAEPLFVLAEQAMQAAAAAADDQQQQAIALQPEQLQQQGEAPRDNNRLREFIRFMEVIPVPDHPVDRLIKEGIIKITKLQLQRQEMHDRAQQRQRARDREARMQRLLALDPEDLIRHLQNEM